MSDFENVAHHSDRLCLPPPETGPDGAAEIVTFLDVRRGEMPQFAAAPASTPLDDLSVRPGPGLLEACGWTALVLMAQLVASVLVMVVALVAMIVWEAVANDGRIPSQPPELTSFGPDASALIFGLPGFLGYLVLIPLACWRISPTPLRRLNFSKPSLTQALIVCSCVLPLGFLSDALYTLTQPLWEQLLEQLGWGEWNELGLAEAMKQLNGASLPLLLFFISVVPAIGEEWMLRGLIGRGLVARWGIVPGIMLTSVLFAAMHLDPPHVAAVLPIGIVIHFVYLTTRSFWMPILFHFLNNATVSVFTSLGTAEPGKPPDPDGSPWSLTNWLTILAVPYLAVAMTVLWKLRTQYLGPDGREVQRGYFTFEHLPEADARRAAPNQFLAALIFGLLLAVQVQMLGFNIWSIQQEQAAPVGEIETHPAAGGTPWNRID